MELAPKLFLARKHASVSDAKHAYFEGDFERCLEICTDIGIGTIQAASEIALIKARAFLRTGRADEARLTIAATRALHATLDAGLTAQMLEATALIRLNEADAGIALLLKAARLAGGAHFAIRSEIAFCTALGYWAKRDIDVAQMYLEAVDPRSDIIHARALELQAWCYAARRDYQRSALFFRLTLLRLDDCQAGDRAIAATAISTLAIFAAELFDRDIAQFVETRARSIVWTSGISAQQYITLEHQALFYEFTGDTLGAYRFALLARESASNVADKVAGCALMSSVARNAGERYSATIQAQQARDLLGQIDPELLNGEERFSLLCVAENYIHSDPATALKLFATYTELRPLSAMHSASDDPRRTAYETYVAGLVAQAQAQCDRAERCYRSAFEVFKELGYVRRAVVAAHLLLELCDDERVRSYVEERLAGTTNYISKALGSNGPATPAHDVNAALEHHPVVTALPRTQRQIVTLICMGKTNREIAELRHVGEQTIKNMLSKSVFPAFGVSSRAALVSACLRERFSEDEGAGHPAPCMKPIC